jgi:hypothetical protein
MNADAEAQILEIYSNAPCASDGQPIDTFALMRAAMQWAYADAARICREVHEEDYVFPARIAARAIEERAK